MTLAKRHLLLTACVLAAVSGAAGLMHQILWVRRMVDILGADAGTFSRVVGAFFLGLSVGAWGAARTATPRPWLGVTLAESVVAVLAAIVLAAGTWADRWQLFALNLPFAKWLLPLLLVTPPAIAMGAVLPWMLRALPGRFALPVYALNTLGGIAGLALVQSWALPRFGINGASVVAMALNVSVTLAALRLISSAPAHSWPEAWPPSSLPSLATGDMLLAFASGFLILASEVLYQHQFAQLLISSHFSSTVVLALVLGALGVAAFVTPLFVRLGGRALPVALTLAALACAVQPFVLVVQRGGLNFLSFNQTHTEYLLSALRLGLPGCALPLLASGFVFPLLLRRATLAGIDTGWLLAVNGLGGWLGSECAERFLAPAFGLWWAMTVLAGAYALCLLVTTGTLRFWLVPALAVVVAGAWKINGRLPFAALNKGETLVHVAVGREGVVGVVRGQPDDWRIIFNNTYTLGGSRAQFNQERQVLLPMLLHGDARRVAALGVATGSSLAGATLDPTLESATGIELSPLVLQYAQQYFAPFNRHMASDPRVHLIVSDARIEIAKHAASFDVIEGDLFLPWRTGEGRLFTREHFSNVRAALRPGGLFCQWLPVYQLTRPQFEAIVRTFREIFPDAWLVRGDFYVERPIVALIGGRRLEDIDWAKVETACARVRAGKQCRDPLLRHAEGVAMCVVGPLPKPAPGPINTLGNAWLEWDAARYVIGLHEDWFTGLPLADDLRLIQRASATLLPDYLQAAQNTGDQCVALEIARTANLPQASQIEAGFRTSLPIALREDADVDWQHWPMRYRPSLP